MSEVIDDSIIDVDEASPDLKRLAEEVEASGKPRVLRLAGRDVATVNPTSIKDWRPTAEQLASFRSAAGGWRGIVDVEQLKANIREGRKSSRPPVKINLEDEVSS